MFFIEIVFDDGSYRADKIVLNNEIVDIDKNINNGKNETQINLGKIL